MKVHFLSVSEPDLKEGSELTANCGAIIKNAAFAMKFDFVLGEAGQWNPFLICEECRETEAESRKKKQFIYGIVEWQSALRGSDDD